MKKELESVINPVMTKLYSSDGGQEENNEENKEENKEDGPKVEEVD